MKAGHFTLLGLLLAVIVSAVAVVYSKHLSRKYFNELEQARRESDRLESEWEKLQLELSTLADHGRIETLASKKLNMAMPPNAAVMVVRQ